MDYLVTSRPAIEADVKRSSSYKLKEYTQAKGSSYLSRDSRCHWFVPVSWQRLKGRHLGQ